MVVAAQASSIVARGRPRTRRVEAVAELGVDVGGADRPPGQLGPGEGVLVRAAGAADDGDRRRAAVGERGLDAAPAAASMAADHDDGDQLVALADQRRASSRSGEFDRLEAEAALVAQPAPVDRVAVDALVAQQLVRGSTGR